MLAESQPGNNVPRRRRRTTFRPRFTIMVLYMFVFFLAYALAFALPSLLEGYQSLPPGSGPLTAEELDQAEEISRRAVRGKLHLAFAAALLTTAAGAWFRALPGLRG